MNEPVQTLLGAVSAAGAAILALQTTGFTVTHKANRDLLTQADLLANDILKEALLGKFPHYGWLSEESVDDPGRLERQCVWVVDPIDGTKEYVEGIGEYAVSVALVENGEPILACVFNPVTNELFHAIKGGGAFLNGQRIYCVESVSDQLVLLASRSEYRRGEWQRFDARHQVKQIGSIAYKLALVAAGLADATFSLGPKSEWDIAAGVLLVMEAGGKVTDQARSAFVFNQERVLVNGIVASSKETNDQVFEMISAL